MIIIPRVETLRIIYLIYAVVSKEKIYMVTQISKLLLIATVIFLGLSAGAMLTEAVLFVPYWKKMPAQDFLAWFRNNEPHLVSFFGTSQILGLIVTLLVTILYQLQRLPNKNLLAIATLINIFILLLYPIYFKQANASFAAATIDLNNVSQKLINWGMWQWVRTFLGISAFFVAVLALKEKNN
ncbi:MAG: DUF1772 domain-containing protein [Acidobacteria bacterium]|nr:DUF1772 domain-containing protein [Acidobacteriota bacterium]